MTQTLVGTSRQPESMKTSTQRLIPSSLFFLMDRRLVHFKCKRRPFFPPNLVLVDNLSWFETHASHHFVCVWGDCTAWASFSELKQRWQQFGRPCMAPSRAGHFQAAGEKQTCHHKHHQTTIHEATGTDINVGIKHLCPKKKCTCKLQTC